MKKKILSICLAAVIAVMAITGASLAYLTDTDEADNVFTVGNVAISLDENYKPNSKLIPAVPVKDETTGKTTYNNAITKEIDVVNDGSEDAYVRVHIAIPAMLDSGSEDEPQYAAYNNTLHFNMSTESFADGKWNWNADKDGANYPGNGSTWNCYQQVIGNVTYNVYVVTYETALKKDEVADNAIHQVYLDPKVTNEKITEINKVLGKNWEIKVVAEGTQAAGFADAYTALNASFGAPGTYNPWAE